MKTSKIIFTAASLLALPTLSGCLDLLGFEDPILDNCAPDGCAGGGTGGAGGSGGSGGTGGAAAICKSGETRPCYGGATGTENVGLCKAGLETCNEAGTAWGPCTGEVVPQQEICANQDDENCDDAACGKALWVKAFDTTTGAQTAAAAFDHEGNLVLAGTFFGGLNFPGYPLVSQSNADLFVAKLDPDGTPLWAKAYGPTAFATNMALTSDGSIVVQGNTYGASTIDFSVGPIPQGHFVAKFSSSGDFDWVAPYGGFGVQCGGIATDNDDRVIVIDCGSSGSTLDFGDGVIDPANGRLVVAVLDGQTGAKKDHRQFPGEGYSKSVVVDSANAILVGGQFGTIDLGDGLWSSVGSSDIFVLKMNPSLQTTWARQYSGTIGAQADRIIVDTLGNPIITGTYKGSLKLEQIQLDDENSISTTRFVSKLDFLGFPQWATSVEGMVTIFNGFAWDASGNVFLGGLANGAIEIEGQAFGSDGELGGFLTKLTPGGKSAWTRYFLAGTADAIAAPQGNNDVFLCGSGATADSDLGLGPLGGQMVQKVIVARYAP